MSDHFVTYVKAPGLVTPVTAMYVKLPSGEAGTVIQMYERDILSPDGYSLVFTTPTLPVDVVITSLTQDACVDQEIICIAATPAGDLSYDFEIEFSSNNWIGIQDSANPTWDNVQTFGGPGALQGYRYRCVVTATDGTDTDTKIIEGGRLQPACEGTTDDWNTFQLGAGTIPAYTSGTNTVTYNAAYPNVTAASQFNAKNISGPTTPYNYVPQSNYTSEVMYPYMSQYAAVYITAEEAASGAYGRGDTEGWFVFGTAEPTNPTGDGYMVWTEPIAWPAGTTYDNGYLGISNSDPFTEAVVWLSDYTGATGSGGTAGWTTPTELLP